MSARAGRRVVLLLLALSGACVALDRDAIFPPERDQVFLAYFDNDTFYRDYQFELTERIRDEILSRPGLRLTSKETAEVVVGGRIVDVRQRVLSDDRQRDVTSESTTITVVVELKDAQTGQVIRTKKLSRIGRFVPAFSEDLDDGRDEAFSFLARDIVRLLEAPF